MDYKTLIDKILINIRKDVWDSTAYTDLYVVCKEAEETEFEAAHAAGKELRDRLMYAIRMTQGQVPELYSLYEKVLLFNAPYDLDSYLLYLELDRKPEERFYQPRRKVLKRVVDAMQALVDGDMEELFVSMPPRVGKLLADDTPVLTTNGWKNHGDLKVGDMVFSPEGIPVPVIGVLPKHHTTHTVTFSDGSKVDCHFRHEWEVYDRRFGKVRMLETQEMIGHLENGKKNGNHRGHRYNFMVTSREPIRGVPVSLKVSPYTLGAWLGDGSNVRPRITGVDEEIIQAVIADGYSERCRHIHKTTGVTSVDFDGLRSALTEYGMCRLTKTDKYIPEVYLIAPLHERLELLAGLLDTDGCLRKREHRYDFTTSDPRLKESFIDLIHTFGWRVSIKECKPCTSSSGIVGKKTYWVISFNPTMEIPCRLERKRLTEFSKQRKLSIVSIEPSEEKQGNCITVAGGMYLAGRNMVPTHNTTLLMFFVTWVIGRNSEMSNLYSAFSDTITRAFYNGVLEVLTDPYTYRWKKVFPYAELVSTNAADETVNIDRKKRYPSLTCRSLYGTLNGACDCSGLLIADDLIGSIEEALNKDRLRSTWDKVDNNLLTRAKQQAKILWVGTRWSLVDPAGVRMELIENDERFKDHKYRIINLPAMDENDESNFDYDYGVGFSTQKYRERRASFERNNDMASWNAQYMGEPIERDGSLFAPNDFEYYNGILPDERIERVFIPVDPAYGGGDFVAAPCCVMVGEKVYMPDVVYDNSDKRITQPKVAAMAQKQMATNIRVEGTKSTVAYKEGLQTELDKLGYSCLVTSKANAGRGAQSKLERIMAAAPDIRERFVFLEPGCRSREYERFLQNVFSLTIVGKNKHDDAPDSLSMAIEMIGKKNKATVFRRPI